jgi:hypothetical protein
MVTHTDKVIEKLYELNIEFIKASIKKITLKLKGKLNH